MGLVEDEDDLFDDNLSSDKSSESDDNDERNKDNSGSHQDNDSDDIMVSSRNST